MRRKVVQCIGHDGNGAEQRSGGQLAQAQKQVAGHAHHTGQVAVGGADSGGGGILRVFDEEAEFKNWVMMFLLWQWCAAARTLSHGNSIYFSVAKCFAGDLLFFSEKLGDVRAAKWGNPPALGRGKTEALLYRGLAL